MKPPRDIAIWVLLGVFLVCMLVFGAKYHPIEEVNSAEWDCYVDKAIAIRNGDLPGDEFHPLLYPILAAGAGAALGDTFAGARLISTLFATLFVASAYLIGRACFSRSAGLFAAAAMAVNPNVVFFGVHVATDMMFAALMAVTLVALLRVFDSDRVSAVIPAAVLFGLAYFTRYSTAAAWPALVVPLLFGGRVPSRSQAIMRVLVFAGVCALVLVPHFVLTQRALGDPFVNESWRNFAFKIHAQGNWDLLNDNPYDGALSVIRDQPVAFVVGAVREMVKFVFITMLVLGGYGLAGGLFAAGTLVGAYATLGNLDRRRLTLLAYVVGSVAIMCVFYYTTPRLTLPILPVCYAWVGHSLFGLAPAGPIVWGRLRFAPAWPLAILVVGVTLASTAREIPRFIAMHPVEEVATLVGLEKQYGPVITVYGTAPYFGRHVHYDYRYLRAPSGPGASGPNAYIDRLRAQVIPFDYVVIGRLTARGAPLGLIDGTQVPEFLTLVELSPAAAVYRANMPSGTE